MVLGVQIPKTTNSSVTYTTYTTDKADVLMSPKFECVVPRQQANTMICV